jgi:hypothetical protein
MYTLLIHKNLSIKAMKRKLHYIDINHHFKKIVHVIIPTFFVLALFSVLFFSNKGSLSAQSSTPHWVEMTPLNDTVYIVYARNCGTIVNPDAYNIIFFRPGYAQYREDSRCLGGSPVYTGTDGHKPVSCPTGEIAVGVRDWQHATGVDDEHVDALCAAVDQVPITGASSWISAPNAFTTLYGGYKVATCPSNQVMTGVRMYGIYLEVDDEHVDALCAPTSATISGQHWVEAPNAFTTLYGSYKQAVCPAGEVAVGVRWYQWAVSIDEEHTDVLCAVTSQSVTPTVNINFR